MPLFSSKFTFKKSPQRRHTLEESISNEQKEEISSLESDEDDEEGLEETDEAGQSRKNQTSGKQLNKSKKSQSAVASNTKTSKKLASKSIKKKDSSKVTGDISPHRKVATNRKVKKTKRKNNKADVKLLLCLDETQDNCLQFDVDQGKWRELSPTNGNGAPSADSPANNQTNNNSETNRPSELATRNKVLEEENRLLKLKIEILMEMVTETTAELNLKEKYVN